MILNLLQVFYLICELMLECFTKLPVNNKGTVNHISKKRAFPNFLSTCI